MTTAQKDSIVQRVGRILDERISLARWFRQNACAGRNLPFEDSSELRVVVENSTNAEQPSVASHPTASQPAQKPAQPAEKNWLEAIPGWVKAAVLLAIGSGAGLLISGNDTEKEPAKPEVVLEQPTEILVKETPTGSLLQDLEDRGFHLAE